MMSKVNALFSSLLNYFQFINCAEITDLFFLYENLDIT